VQLGTDGRGFLFVPRPFPDPDGGPGAFWEGMREFPRVTSGSLSRKNPAYFDEALWGL